MINCKELSEVFKNNNLDFFTGVPDSIFKNWMKFLNDEHGSKLTNIIACNECEASAITSGYYLATGKIGVVYMQNSGLGKCVNPSTSLLDREVYSIPAIFMVGWRGEPEKKDEPQHKKMGRIMLPLLNTLEIPYKILPDNINEAEQVIKEVKQIAKNNNSPAALIIKKGSLEDYIEKNNIKTNYEMSREDAIKTIINNFNGSEAIVSTTGKTSRELFEYRIARNEKPRDFYTIGSMGCSASIALGIALQKPNKKIFIFDGDGAVLMQMGALGTISYYQPKNLHHIVFDNESHDSTGGQPTISKKINLSEIALAAGYKSSKIVKAKQDLIDSLNQIKDSQGPNMIVIKVNKGARKDLGRPITTPIENKKTFMNFLKS